MSNCWCLVHNFAVGLATDVATEMGTYKMQWLGHCDICLKAWDAAEGMLAVSVFVILMAAAC